MESISVTKDAAGALSKEKMAQAAFGILCEAFARRIMERAGYHEGLYRQVALEFLQEGEATEAPPAQNIFNIDLSLVLKTIRGEIAESRSKPAAEKLLEHMIRIREKQGSRPARGARTTLSPPPVLPFFWQNILGQTPPPASRTADRKPEDGGLAAPPLRGGPGGPVRPGGETGSAALKNIPPARTMKITRYDAAQRRLTALPYGPQWARARLPALLRTRWGTDRKPESSGLLGKERTMARGAGSLFAAGETIFAARKPAPQKSEGVFAAVPPKAMPMRTAAGSAFREPYGLMTHPDAGERERRGAPDAAGRPRHEEPAAAMPGKAGKVPRKSGLPAGVETARRAGGIRGVLPPVKGDTAGKTAPGTTLGPAARDMDAPDIRPGENAPGTPPQELTYSGTGRAPSPTDASIQVSRHEPAHREDDRLPSPIDASIQVSHHAPAHRGDGRAPLSSDAFTRIPRHKLINRKDGRLPSPIDASIRAQRRESALRRAPIREGRTPEDAGARAATSPGASILTAAPMKRASREIRSVSPPLRGGPTGKTAPGITPGLTARDMAAPGSRQGGSASSAPPRGFTGAGTRRAPSQPDVSIQISRQELAHPESARAPSPTDGSIQIPRQEPAHRESARPPSQHDVSIQIPRQEPAHRESARAPSQHDVSIQIPRQEPAHRESARAPSQHDVSIQIPRQEPAHRESVRAPSQPDGSIQVLRQELAHGTPIGEGRTPEDAEARAGAGPGASVPAAEPMKRALRDIRSVPLPVQGDPSGKTALGTMPGRPDLESVIPESFPGGGASGVPTQELTHSATDRAPLPTDTSIQIPHHELTNRGRDGASLASAISIQVPRQELTRRGDGSAPLPTDTSIQIPRHELTNRGRDGASLPSDASVHVSRQELTHRGDGSAPSLPDVSIKIPHHELTNRGRDGASLPSAISAQVPRQELTYRRTPAGEERPPEDAGACAEVSPGASMLTAEPMKRASRDIRSAPPPARDNPADQTVSGVIPGLFVHESVGPGSRPGESAASAPPQELTHSAAGRASLPADASIRMPDRQPQNRQTDPARRFSMPGQDIPAGENFRKGEGRRSPNARAKDRPLPAGDRGHPGGAPAPAATAAQELLWANRDIRIVPPFPHKAEATGLPQDAESSASAQSTTATAGPPRLPEGLIHPELETAAFAARAPVPADPGRRGAGGPDPDAISRGPVGGAPWDTGSVLPKRGIRPAAPFPAGSRAMRGSHSNAEAFAPAGSARRNALAAHLGATTTTNPPGSGEELLHRGPEGPGAGGTADASIRPRGPGRTGSQFGLQPGIRLMENLRSRPADAPRMNGLRLALVHPPFSPPLRTGAVKAKEKDPGSAADAAKLRDARARKFGENAKGTPVIPPVELEYGRMAQDLRQEAPQPGRSANPMDSEYVGSLPGWAQSFLKSGAAEQAAFPPGEGMRPAAARDISVLAKPEPAADQIDWSAPLPQRRPAEMDLFKKGEPKETPARPAPLSDAEIRRTADKVYRMLEDRIRRERGRLGL